jgi:hypothetical protein
MIAHYRVHIRMTRDLPRAIRFNLGNRRMVA